ncbi:MAG: hypothetical protein EA382_04635 [Spirochaetaceae bacterium]|nr:MAG: hypothetical protein EA382_04635 [Spirochaetaceae bacterium]
MRDVTLLLSVALYTDGDTAGSTADRIGTLCGILSVSGLEAPVLWSAPAADLAAIASPSKPEVLHPLIDRLERCGDRIAPMGLTGADHCALLIDEIRRDLEWSISNSWSTGTADTLDLRPVALCPIADPFRPEADTLYRSHPLPVIRIATDARRVIAVAPDGVLPVVCGSRLARPVTGGALGRAIRRSAAAAAGSAASAPGVVVWAEPWIDASALSELISAYASLVARHRIRPAIPALTGEPAAADRTAPAERGAVAIPSHVAACVGARRLIGLRSGRASRLRTRRVLEAACGLGAIIAQPAGEDSACQTPPPAFRRDFIASMLGTAVIAGDQIAIAVADGHYCGVATDADLLRFDQPAISIATVAEAAPAGTASVAIETVESCFSFETESSRGLHIRSAVVTPDAAAELQTELTLVNGHDTLVMTRTIAVTAGGRISTILSNGVPIAPDAVVSIRYSDGSGARVRPGGGDASGAPDLVTPLQGHSFTVEDATGAFTVVAVDTDGSPLSWTLSIGPDPTSDRRARRRNRRAHGTPLRAYIGGCVALRPRSVDTVALLIAPCDRPNELQERALSDRLPHAVLMDIAAAAASTRR